MPKTEPANGFDQHARPQLSHETIKPFQNALRVGGFATLAAVVPCCGAATSLDALDYDWPCGFARFEIAIWNPERAWFSDEELTTIGDALGHPVQQVRAHI